MRARSSYTDFYTRDVDLREDVVLFLAVSENDRHPCVCPVVHGRVRLRRIVTHNLLMQVKLYTLGATHAKPTPKKTGLCDADGDVGAKVFRENLPYPRACRYDQSRGSEGVAWEAECETSTHNGHITSSRDGIRFTYIDMHKQRREGGTVERTS
jgi:hypothetical protein